MTNRFEWKNFPWLENDVFTAKHGVSNHHPNIGLFDQVGTYIFSLIHNPEATTIIFQLLLFKCKTPYSGKLCSYVFTYQKHPTINVNSSSYE